MRNNEKLVSFKKRFDDYAHKAGDGVEFWYARELDELLGYSDWRNYHNSIDKAILSCKTSNASVDDYFVEVNKIIELT